MQFINDLNICFLSNDSTMDDTLGCINDIVSTKSKNTNVNFYILGDNISDEYKLFLNGFATSDSEITITTIDISEYTKLFDVILNTKSDIDKEKLKLRLSLFYVPEILKDLDKVLYLNETTFVRKDLREIYRIECFSNDYIIAAKDPIRNWIFDKDDISDEVRKIREDYRDEICSTLKHYKRYRWLGQFMFSIKSLRNINFSNMCLTEWFNHMPKMLDPYDIINKLFGDHNTKAISNRLIFPYANFYDMTKFAFCRRIRWYNELYITGIKYEKKKASVPLVQPLCDNAAIWYIDKTARPSEESKALIEDRKNKVEKYKKSISCGSRQIENGFLERNNVNIALAFDENYSFFAMRCINEIILKRKESTKLIFHLLIDNISQNSVNTLIKLNSIDNVEIHMINVHNRIVNLNERYKEINQNTMNISWWINGVSAIKLFISDILTNLDKVLYIDVDTIVNSDLKELYDMSFDEKMIIAPIDVPSIIVNSKHPSYSFCKKSFDSNRYFNVNILLMNLAKLRETRFIETCTNLLYQSNAPYKDKDILNYLCVDVVKLLDSRYSLSISNMSMNKTEYNDIQKYNEFSTVKFNSIKELIDNGIIYHFSGNKNEMSNNEYVMSMYKSASENLTDVLK